MRSLGIAFVLSLLACKPAGPTTPLPSEPIAATPPAAEPAPMNAAAPDDARQELKRAARKLLAESARCRELARTKSQLYTPIKVRAEIAANGVAKIVSVEHTPDRKPLADCYVETLQQHHFERAPGSVAVEIELELPMGAMDKDVIRRVVRSHLDEVRACYEQALGRDANAKGRVAITFTIAPDGTVAVAEVVEDTMKDAAVGSCIAAAAETWKFPEPEGGGNVVVTYPFVLEPG